jgi:hypothetical protein
MCVWWLVLSPARVLQQVPSEAWLCCVDPAGASIAACHKLHRVLWNQHLLQPGVRTASHCCCCTDITTQANTRVAPSEMGSLSGLRTLLVVREARMLGRLAQVSN